MKTNTEQVMSILKGSGFDLVGFKDRGAENFSLGVDLVKVGQIMYLGAMLYSAGIDYVEVLELGSNLKMERVPPLYTEVAFWPTLELTDEQAAALLCYEHNEHGGITTTLPEEEPPAAEGAQQ